MRSRTRVRTLATLAALVLALLWVVGLAQAGAASPILWDPANSTYNGTSFVAVGSPAPPGTGRTQDGSAYGGGGDSGGVEGFGFTAGPIFGPPTMAQTELTGTALPAGTQLLLHFTKPAGLKVNYIAILADPNAKVSVNTGSSVSLTDATAFWVIATIPDPVKSAGGDVSAAFGLTLDYTADPARDYDAALFVTDMHFLDVQPPTLSVTGRAGLSANGFAGIKATFDGIFSGALLTRLGATNPALVAGHIDTGPIFPGSTTATFGYRGMGSDTLWDAGLHKFRITNSSWSAHNVLWGRLAKPGKPTAKSPKGVIRAVRPTFRWSKIGLAKTYEVRVYKGTKLLVKKTGITATSWRCSKALPKGVWLKWKVRAKNAAGLGLWSTARTIKVR